MIRIAALVIILLFGIDQTMLDGRYTLSAKTIAYLLLHRA